jgi:uridine kinase
MKGMQRTRVIALSGVSGAGKTSVIKCLAEAFNSPTLLFDDFVGPNTYPLNMKAWLHQGTDVSQIKSPRFTKALSELKTQCGSPMIFIEEPFGRERAEIAHLIDYVIMLDMPMEVCLSRVIQRHLKHSNDPFITLSNYLRKYDDHLRDVYIRVSNQVRENSDLVVTELEDVVGLASMISKCLKK